MFDEGVTMEGYEKHSFRIKKDSEYQKYLKDELDDYTKWVAVNYNEYTAMSNRLPNILMGQWLHIINLILYQQHRLSKK